ncbi:MAG: aldehyde ferredoxin oxidoreductase family protein [Candidatus Bathyarchaeota archaeon]|nr:MAG: aldehyde ferredoxin oxidoreductase family protein [Candidatus Bathyarchaeota archaeon]
MFGYAGKILYVDLRHKKTTIKPTQNKFCEKYIGGNGFAIRLLYDNTKPNIDPLSPENVLIFAVGPFAGTMVPTSGKYIVQAKSPLTNFMGESVSSGAWGQAFKRAGYDAMVIKGRAEKPTYLFLDDNIIEFRDAKNLWGKDSLQTGELIVDEIGDENVCPATIGPAGENLVQLANITNDRYRQAGRTGMGAVMGSKNLKAVAVRGTKKIEVGNLEKLMEVCQEIYEECQGAKTKGYRVYGTPASVLVQNHLAALPTRNWQQSTFEMAENISGEYIREHCLAKVIACSGCPIACDHLSVIEDGPYKGITTSVEFETIYALGSHCGIGYFPAISKASDLCDRLGIDTISTGVTIGWAMECFEKGILTKKDTGGIELTFGNHEALIEVISKIAYREGIGELLAGGVKRAAKKVGKGSEHFAMHNKGLEFPGYDLRGLKASALGFNTSTRGGCHLRSSMYDYDAKGKVDRFKADKSLGALVKEREELWAIVDSLILCKFLRGVVSTSAKFAELYTLVTGIKMTANQMQKAGERIYNLEKAYNVREGWVKKDDYQPPRIMEDPIPDGVAKGSLVTKKEIGLMLNAYFKARNWNSAGIPTKEKLVELGLNKIAKKIGAA